MRARGTLFLLTGILACVGAVAYAAAPRHHAGSGKSHGSGRATPLPKPTISQHPDKMDTTGRAKFAFTARGRGLRFECKLDSRPWSACRAPASFSGLAPGQHSFSVRVLAPHRRHGNAARFRWSVLAPKDFSIEPRLAGLGDLYPGAPPQALPVTVVNPNPVPIYVTALRVKASTEPFGCSSAENLVLAASSASATAPLPVPANGSASLPAPGVSAPTIQLRDLPVDQDDCQGTRFELAFAGEARG
jgi:hypothetical protein